MRDAFRLSAILWAAVLIALVDAVALWKTATRGINADWTVLWAATQAPYADIQSLPFAYPPSALLLLAWFGQLPFLPSLLLWSLLGTAALLVAASRLTSGSSAMLALLAPAWLVSALSGQTSLIVGSLAIGGVISRSPVLAGLCFGSAAMIKPHVMIALPIALLAARQWSTALWTAASALALLLLSLLLWGVAPWLQWAEALPEFRRILAEQKLRDLGVGANGLGLRAGLPWLYWVGLPLGAAATWSAFRGEDRIERYAGLVVGAALISPYMMHYDLAGLGAAGIAILRDRARPPLMWAGAALAISYVLAPVGIILLAIALLRHALPERAPPDSKVPELSPISAGPEGRAAASKLASPRKVRAPRNDGAG